MTAQNATQSQDDAPQTNSKPVFGRPTIYCADLVARAHAYVDGGYELEGDVLPTIEGLALWLNVRRSTLNEWAHHDDKKDFSEVFEKCKTKQAKMLLGGGLSSTYNATITKLMLSKHGYADAQTVETTQNVNITQQLDIKDAARMIEFMMTQAKQIAHDDGTTTIQHSSD